MRCYARARAGVWPAFTVPRCPIPLGGKYCEAVGAVHDARNSTGRVYPAVSLFAGNVLFDEVGMLQTSELDGEAVVDVTHHAALRLAKGD